jgi:transcriptional regulator with XRE-family HTH domain
MASITISGKKLQAARRAIKMSQEELASKMSITRQTINAWEKREEINVTPETLLLLTEVLNDGDLKISNEAPGAIPESSIEFYERLLESKQNEIIKMEKHIQWLQHVIEDLLTKK